MCISRSCSNSTRKCLFKPYLIFKICSVGRAHDYGGQGSNPRKLSPSWLMIDKATCLLYLSFTTETCSCTETKRSFPIIYNLIQVSFYEFNDIRYALKWLLVYDRLFNVRYMICYYRQMPKMNDIEHLYIRSNAIFLNNTFLDLRSFITSRCCADKRHKRDRSCGYTCLIRTQRLTVYA